MRVAQALYEGKEIGNMQVGLITYMRTDSTRLSDLFVSEAHKFIVNNYGKEYAGSLKVKNKDVYLFEDTNELLQAMLRYKDIIVDKGSKL